jgi:hypothetical protein
MRFVARCDSLVEMRSPNEPECARADRVLRTALPELAAAVAASPYLVVGDFTT